MTAPLSDRDRWHAAEARIAELELELDAWRAGARREAQEAEYAARVHALKHEFRRGVGAQKARQFGIAAKALLQLMAHAGAVRTYAQLAMAWARDPDEANEQTAKIAMFVARAALRRWGLADGLQNVWGVGYVLDAATAAAIEARIRTAAS